MPWSAPWVTIRVVSPLDILVSRLPDGAVRTDTEMLRERAIDSWALALLRRVRGDELPVPAAVVFPASTEEAGHRSDGRLSQSCTARSMTGRSRQTIRRDAAPGHF